MCIKNNCIDLENANTHEKRKQGLMHRPFLKKNEGMLFSFDTEKIIGIWMKNTLIPLDIIWLNKNLKIQKIVKNAIPFDSTTLYHVKPSLYVIEINAGLSQELGLTIGQTLHLKKLSR
ncbi:hypothetical protein DID78_01100 [Candidatus Marinamargulisbacteria bacterium SCGC AG-343-D04]|nr:hypothetical protein DID78_01100 [Candidatus Marinamargulisbacteria bacterium SCGC AG-343-D04]